MATKCGAILCYFLNYLLLPWYTLGDTFELVNFIMWRIFLKTVATLDLQYKLGVVNS